jgi:hypothetical protein
MLKKAVVTVVVLSTFLLASAFAANNCFTLKSIGSFTRLHGPFPNPDLFGDGSNINHDVAYFEQLNLHIDGTAEWFYTGGPDLVMNAGGPTPASGSWKCRADGMLVVTLVRADYLPSDDSLTGHSWNGLNPVVSTFRPDLLLQDHLRSTWLFSITDGNTLTLVQRRGRLYTGLQDPTDPAGGTLLPLHTDSSVYKRLVASDADLLLP